MKISEMNNEQATEALVRLSVPFGNICEDEKMVQLIEDYNKNRKTPMIQAFGKLFPQICTYALKEHKSDMYEIVGALTFKTQSEVAKMNFFETAKVLRESYDEVLINFFTSSVRQTAKQEGK